MPVNITQGSGTSIAADLVNGNYYQYMKIATGATGGSTAALVGNNGLYVDVRSGGSNALDSQLDGHSQSIGAKADAAITTSGSNGSVIALLKGMITHAYVRMPAALGQGTMAQSLPVVIASNQSTLTVTANAGTGTSGGSTADGYDITQGALADAAVAAGAAGSISAKLRSISRDLVANIVLAAGTALIGKVGLDQTTPGTTNRTQAGGTTADIDANFTRPSDTTAYTANDAVCSSGSTCITFTSMARSSGGSGVILDAVLIDESNPATTGSFDLYLFDTTFTPTSDNLALALSAAIYRTFVGKISFDTVSAGGANAQQYHVTGKSLAFVTVGSANLFGQLVARNGYTPSSAGRLDVRLKVLQD